MQLISVLSPVNHYIRIISGLKETFIKRRISERTRVRKLRVVGRIYEMKYSWKGHKDRNRHKNRIKRSGQARLVYSVSSRYKQRAALRNTRPTWQRLDSPVRGSHCNYITLYHESLCTAASITSEPKSCFFCVEGDRLLTVVNTLVPLLTCLRIRLSTTCSAIVN